MREDIRLLTLAQKHTNLSELEFLVAIFEANWNAAAGLTVKPEKAEQNCSGL
jgi:hypothetical protein